MRAGCVNHAIRRKAAQRAEHRYDAIPLFANFHVAGVLVQSTTLPDLRTSRRMRYADWCDQAQAPDSSHVKRVADHPQCPGAAHLQPARLVLAVSCGCSFSCQMCYACYAPQHEGQNDLLYAELHRKVL